MKNYFLNLYESFRRIYGIPVTLLGICLGILAFNYSSSDTISLKIIVPVSVVLFLILITLFDNSIYNFNKASNVLPRVNQARPPTSLYNGAKAILLLEPSDIFAHETWVSIYLSDDGFEQLIGIGFILTVQRNGLIQVLVSKSIEDEGNNTWERICNNDLNILAKLQVKPSVPKILGNIGE